MLKRYPARRRIYDTELSCYVSIAQIRPRLLQGETVWEAGTGRDITAHILARMIVDEMHAGASTPTVEQLREFIVTHDTTKSSRKVV